jgi:hypothetical protein
MPRLEGASSHCFPFSFALSVALVGHPVWSCECDVWTCRCALWACVHPQARSRALRRVGAPAKCGHTFHIVVVLPAAEKPFWLEAEDADHLFGAHTNMIAGDLSTLIGEENLHSTMADGYRRASFPRLDLLILLQVGRDPSAVDRR